VPPCNAAKYLRQLCKHWSHRVAVDLKEDTGIVVFPDAVATLTAAPAALIVVVEAETSETLDRIKRVVPGISTASPSARRRCASTGRSLPTRPRPAATAAQRPP